MPEREVDRRRAGRVRLELDGGRVLRMGGEHPRNVARDEGGLTHDGGAGRLWRARVATSPSAKMRWLTVEASVGAVGATRSEGDTRT